MSDTKGQGTMDEDVPLTTSDTARVLGLTSARVMQMDDVLLPTRCGTRGQRIFSRAHVLRVAEARAAARAAR